MLVRFEPDLGISGTIQPADRLQADSFRLSSSWEWLGQLVLYCPAAVGLIGSNNLHNCVIEGPIFELWDVYLSGETKRTRYHDRV